MFLQVFKILKSDRVTYIQIFQTDKADDNPGMKSTMLIILDLVDTNVILHMVFKYMNINEYD